MAPQQDNHDRVGDIEYGRVNVDVLQTFENNPREGDVAAIAESLELRGQYRPLVVNRGTFTGRDMEVLAGNHTLLAARSLGWDSVDVGVIDVDEQTATQIVLADNRLADLGGYDDKSLAELLESLDDLAGTGYTIEDLDELVASVHVPEEYTDPDDAPDLPDDDEVISVPGDVYELGPHRVVCGDSTNPDDVVDKLLYDGLADMVWTDPPYGVDYVGKTKESLTIQNDGSDGLEQLLADAFTAATPGLVPGAPFYVTSPPGPQFADFIKGLSSAGWLWRQTLAWVKNTMVLGHSDYHYRHETVFVGEVPSGDFGELPDDDPASGVTVDDAGVDSDSDADGDTGDDGGFDSIAYGFTPGGKGRLGRGGDRWFGDNAQTSVFMFDKPSRNREHPTMKPTDLILAMLRNSCRPGGVVLDLFGGSGSTIIAAHQGGYRARVVELDPRYVDVICRRWQEHTGVVPVRDGEEVSFV